jgi:hypothetical protein
MSAARALPGQSTENAGFRRPASRPYSPSLQRPRRADVRLCVLVSYMQSHADVSRIAVPLALLACAAVLPSCSSEREEIAEGSSAQTAFAPRVGPEEFRDDFYTYLARDGVSREKAQKLAYLPPPQVIRPPNVRPGSGDDALAPYDRFFASVRPSALYRHGAAHPPSEVADIESTFARSGPIHVILLPGIFGEFIEDRPFEELLSQQGSSAARAWKTISARARGTPQGRVPAYRLATLRTEEIPIDEAVDVASIDDARGEPLVTLAFMRPKAGSLETLGSIEESTATYLPRIDRYTALVGRPKNVIVMGYSRGAPVALDVVAEAARDRGAHPWVDDVAGVGSLAGVLYGTPLADAVERPGNVTGELIGEISGLAQALHSCDPSRPLPVAAWKRSENTARWTGSIAKIAWLMSRLPKHAEIEVEQIASATADLGRFAKMIQRIVFDDALNLDDPLGDYCGNIERFKKIVAMTLRGVDSLTTASRLAWWRTHVVPAEVRVFAITATMGDATRDRRPWPLATDPEVNDARSVDFKSLRTNFYDLFDASGLDLNDSQVTLPRARIWPELHATLNPAQPPLKAYFMGTLGTHHWGLAFPRAIPTQDGLRGNPFPRTALMKAMGTFFSQALVSER